MGCSMPATRGQATRRRVDAIAVGLGVAVFVPCALVASNGRVGPLERRIFEAVNGVPSFLSAPMRLIQFLGVLGIGPAVALVAIVMRRYRLAVAAALITVLKLLAERLIWNLLAIHRERPGTTVPGAIVRGGSPASGVSFVSGHVMLATALAWAITPYLGGRWRLAPWAVVVAVAFARIYLGAHNPLDVLGGAGVGLAIGGCANLVVGVGRHGAHPHGVIAATLRGRT
jgi:membrane-associated phospholipid phosphatase